MALAKQTVRWATFSLLVLLSACAVRGSQSAQEAFFSSLRQLCGKSFAGAATAFDAAQDGAFLASPLMLGPVACGPASVSIPFTVGTDASRLWTITSSGAQLQLTHTHKHGAHEDTLSGYGGATRGAGSAIRQEFPADSFSKTLFLAQGRAASVENVWAVEVETGRRFAYELRRPGRFFRVEFDLSAP